MVTKCSFGHNLKGVSRQKTYLTKVVKGYALMMEIPCRPLNMESVGEKMFISSFLLQEREWCIFACEIFTSVTEPDQTIFLGIDILYGRGSFIDNYYEANLRVLFNNAGYN